MVFLTTTSLINSDSAECKVVLSQWVLTAHKPEFDGNLPSLVLDRWSTIWNNGSSLQIKRINVIWFWNLWCPHMIVVITLALLDFLVSRWLSGSVVYLRSENAITHKIYNNGEEIRQYFIHQNGLQVWQHLTKILLWKDQLLFTFLFEGQPPIELCSNTIIFQYMIT